MATTTKTPMRKPVFTKVDQLKPGTTGHTLTVKVVSCKPVLQKSRASSAHLRPTRISECVVGDETGTIIFTARNEQGNTAILVYALIFSMIFCISIDARELQNPGPEKGESFGEFLSVEGLINTAFDLMKADTSVILRNAKIDMFKGSMRLAVDKWGRVEVTEPAKFVVKEDNNLSLVEYELVSVMDEGP
ncbi:hypothetical protein ACLOJK_010364 [Asimina triloba]